MGPNRHWWSLHSSVQQLHSFCGFLIILLVVWRWFNKPEDSAVWAYTSLALWCAVPVFLVLQTSTIFARYTSLRYYFVPDTTKQYYPLQEDVVVVSSSLSGMLPIDMPQQLVGHMDDIHYELIVKILNNRRRDAALYCFVAVLYLLSATYWLWASWEVPTWAILILVFIGVGGVYLGIGVIWLQRDVDATLDGENAALNCLGIDMSYDSSSRPVYLLVKAVPVVPLPIGPDFAAQRAPAGATGAAGAGVGESNV